MVRFLAVWPDGGTGLREVVFSVVRSPDRRPAGVRRFRGRFCCAPDRCRDLWALRRSHRPQGRLDRDIAADRPVDLPGRMRPHTYEQIGVWGAVLLVILRFIQGIGVGGEWGGSVLLSMEWARTSKNRGLIAAWPQFGGPAGFFLANLAILAFSQMTGDQFLSWGWRVPFWLSIVMVAIGLWIRLGILETPIFQQVIAEERVARAPVIEVFKRQPKEVFLTAFARMGQMAPIFVYIAFIFPYGMQVVHVSRDFLLVVLLIGSFMSFFTIPLSGYLSDRFGRKQVYIFGAVATGLFGFAYYAMFNTAIPGLIILSSLIAFAFHDLMWGPLAALTAESFTPRLRYSGASIGFQLAAVFAGGPAPMIATAILASTGSGQMIALYIFGCAIVSVAATAFLPSGRDRDFTRDHV